MRGVGGRRLLAVARALEALVSVALLLIARTARSNLPAWGGPVDVVVEFAIVAEHG